MASPLARLEGKYEILEKLSEGGMGSVYRVRHRLLDEVRVVKVMRPALASDEVFRARFHREARTAVKLRHRNLAQIHDFTMDEDGYAFLVMEYIDGLPLHEAMDLLERFSLGLTLEIASQALDVLGYLHRKDIVHRDVSPDNLLLPRDDDGLPVVKLIDLGIAKVAEGDEKLTTEGVFLGKVRYSSPEHFKGQEGVEVDGRSDIYSLAVVLYEMLTGHLPIRGGNVSSLIAGHLVHPPLDFAETDPDGVVPEPVREVILRCLAKNPEDRFADADTFRTALAAAVESPGMDPAELRRLGPHESDTTMRVRVHKPGSTQGHLDRNFRLEPTPAQQPATPGGSTASEGQIQALLRGSEKLLEGGHLAESRLQLAAVLELDPENAAARALQRRVDELDEDLQRRRHAIRDEVRSLIASERFTDAQHLLAEARPELGDWHEADELGEEIGAAQTRASERDAAVEEAVRDAGRATDEQRFEQAVELLGQAHQLAPSRSDVRRALDEAKARLEQHRSELRRQQEIEDSARSITEHLDGGNLEEAGRALRVATKLYGDEPQLASLRERLKEAEAAARRAEAAALLARARALVTASEYADALDLVDRATALDPTAAGLADIADRAHEGQRQEEEARRRREQVERTVSHAERLLDLRLVDAARNLVDGCRRELDNPDGLAEITGRIDERSDEIVAAQSQAHELAGRAIRTANVGEVPQAREILDELRRLADGVPEVGNLVEGIEAEVDQAVTAHRQRVAIAEATASIEAHLEMDRLDQADHELDVASRLFGDIRPVARLRRRVDDRRRHTRRQELLDQVAARPQPAGGDLEQIEQELSAMAIQDPTDAEIATALATIRADARASRREADPATHADLLHRIATAVVDGQPARYRALFAEARSRGDPDSFLRWLEQRLDEGAGDER